MAVTGMGASFNAVPLEVNVDDQAVQDLTVEQYVDNYFSDVPILIEVARCESQFRQHDKSGKVLTGVVNSYDKGVMQVNELYHSDKADALGLDLDTLEGNTAYARYLFESKGLQPWISSSKCWKRTEAYKNYRVALALNSNK